jgi:hypothetical protein
MPCLLCCTFAGFSASIALGLEKSRPWRAQPTSAGVRRALKPRMIPLGPVSKSYRFAKPLVCCWHNSDILSSATMSASGSKAAIGTMHLAPPPARDRCGRGRPRRSLSRALCRCRPVGPLRLDRLPLHLYDLAQFGKGGVRGRGRVRGVVLSGQLSQRTIAPLPRPPGFAARSMHQLAGKVESAAAVRGIEIIEPPATDHHRPTRPPQWRMQ